jgi:isoamylase
VRSAVEHGDVTDIQRRAGTPRVRPGEPFPLGATSDGGGTNFSVFSEVAERVELCLFDDRGTETRLDLSERTAYCWHSYVSGVATGQRYGFRVHGPWDPSQGHRCNPAKLLIDPYARAIVGHVDWHPSIFPYPIGSGNDLERDDVDSAPYIPKGLVVDNPFDWEGDRPLRRKLHETVIYEVHVKGFTKRHPNIPNDGRGTYAGLVHPASLNYLTSLGITAVELLPVHQFLHEQHLLDKGLRNYWGYHTYGCFAPHGEYSSCGDTGGQVREFKQMVKALHAAGLEVILDVVYNHTAEGNHLGPMLSFKGIDNRAYYRTVEGDPRHYMDYTGTGNSLNMRHPHALMLVMDSLRYWVQEMHVDGFRFDLASTLARELHDVDRLSAFFDIIHQDPTLRGVKLIAEPWDVGAGGYQVGNFPVRWCEWNGRYRDTVRDYWRGEGAALGEFSRRLTGSADLYEDDGRRPYASVNFITAHDGFTLHDLVSYNDKHNDANGEGNNDGEQHNRSWNAGAEGPTEDEAVEAIRRRQQRNFLTTLLLSQGIPMLLGGDEFGRTQNGNNNAYCQDNELSWFDWESADTDLLAVTRRLIQIRAEHPVFRRRRWFTGRPSSDVPGTDIAWFTPEGAAMADDDWHQEHAKAIAVFLNGDALHDVDDHGQQVRDDSFLVLFNAHQEPRTFTIPQAAIGTQWRLVLDTSRNEPHALNEVIAGSMFEVSERTIVVLSRPRAASEGRELLTGRPSAPRRFDYGSLHSSLSRSRTRACLISRHAYELARQPLHVLVRGSRTVSSPAIHVSSLRSAAASS